jgi:hypothetical protein
LSSFWLTLKQQWTIKISSPLFSIFSLVAILVRSRDHRTQFWKGAIQGPFHQSLVAIGPVVSEEKIKMWNVDGRTTDDRRRTKSDDNSSPGLKARWAKKPVYSLSCCLSMVINMWYRSYQTYMEWNSCLYSLLPWLSMVINMC